MDQIVINFIESAITLAIFFIIYKLFLRNETFFQLNRFYLISSLLFSVTIPFLSISFNSFSDLGGNIQISNSLTDIRQGYGQIGAVIIYGNSRLFSWDLLFKYLKLIYFIGLAISLLFFLTGIARLLWMVASSKKIKHGKYEVIECKDIVVPFSLFKWIIINPEKHSNDDIEKILVHEKMHAFQLHSLDLIFIEVLVILFWFNPFIYWYRKSIREIHEYLADQAVVENGFDTLDYQKLLLKQASEKWFSGLTSSFSYSLSKNRLKMLTMMKSKNSSKIKLILALPVLAISIFLFTNSCELLSSDEETQVSKDISTSSQEPVVNENSDANEVEGEVFFQVDEMPTFLGKPSEEFRFFIRENLKYPKQAIEKSLSGRVFISFIVDKEGYIKDVKVVRGVHQLLDDEAIRVTKLSPRWEPGKQGGKPVNVQFTFPIVFALQ